VGGRQEVGQQASRVERHGRWRRSGTSSWVHSSLAPFAAEPVEINERATTRTHEHPHC
jgi:hypothetical protein